MMFVSKNVCSHCFAGRTTDLQLLFHTGASNIICQVLFAEQRGWVHQVFCSSFSRDIQINCWGTVSCFHNDASEYHAVTNIMQNKYNLQTRSHHNKIFSKITFHHFFHPYRFMSTFLWCAPSRCLSRKPSSISGHVLESFDLQKFCK